MKTRGWLMGAAVLALIGSAPLAAKDISPKVGNITSPKEAFTQEPGSDYFLADYEAYAAYLKTLASQSDRIKLVDIGKSAQGRTMWVAIVSSPENLAKLDHYRNIAQKLAKAEGVDEQQARSLSQEGKAIVWIDAGLHASETVTTQDQIHVIYRMLTKNDPETMRILNDDIILFGQDNPDGLDMIAHWYMRNPDPKKREFDTLPMLYQKYIGHDNNRDFYMSQMPETTNLNAMFFRKWFPQIIYNHHQTGPAGMVVFVPPFRDPFNYNYDPLIMTELNEIGGAMHSRLIGHDMPGSGMRDAARYSTWNNGMERSVSYFHNSIGILTEIIGGPTPTKIPLILDNQLKRGDEPDPIAPQEWHLSDTLEYEYQLDRAVMDFAARNRERLLFNIWKMGNDGIQRGNRDSWTTMPDDIAAAEAADKKNPLPQDAQPFWNSGHRVDPKIYDTVLHAPERRDPRGYILSVDQRDLPTTIAFLNALIKNGVDVMQATKAFTVDGKTYPAGSFVVKTGQAYRPHVLDMFEPQNHPRNLEYPGGPPKPPYDITGYTLAYQMGVGFDRILDGFDGPFQPVSGLLTVPGGDVIGSGSAGWLIGHETNNSFILTNRLLKAGVPVSWIKTPTSADGHDFGPGAIWVPNTAASRSIVTASVKDLGIDAYAEAQAPGGDTLPLKPVRIGLVDHYGGVIPAGWTRWLLEQFEFPYTVVYPQQLDAGNLKSKFDVLIFPDGTVPVPKDGPFRGGRFGKQPNAQDIPAQYRSWLGDVTADKTVPQIARFTKAGGTVITVGSADELAMMLGAPITPALATQGPDGKLHALPSKDFYIPGSLLEGQVDPTQPLAYGMPKTVDLFFDSNQSFNITPGAKAARVSWYDTATPLRSGWALGQEKLNGTSAVVDVDMGQGKLFVMGPAVTKRAEPYATFKLLFNGILYGPAVSAKH